MAGIYLYIYRNDELRQVYIGIGTSPSRVWQRHNAEATELLMHEATRVFLTAEPFADRESAERAESAAICAAAATGVKVLSDHDDLLSLTNIAKVGSSKHLVLAVNQRVGTIRYDDLRQTAIVSLRLDSIDGGVDGARRPTLHGGRSEDVFRDRASRWWGLGSAARRREKKRLANGTLPRDVEQLVAIQKGTHTILGAWRLTDEQWRRDEGSRWEFLPDAPISKWCGQRFDWCGKHPSNGVTWSRDIREEL